MYFLENARISIKISLRFGPNGSINNIPALVQIMAWCRPGDTPLSEPLVVRFTTHICVTRPQWVVGLSVLWDQVWQKPATSVCEAHSTCINNECLGFTTTYPNNPYSYIVYIWCRITEMTQKYNNVYMFRNIIKVVLYAVLWSCHSHTAKFLEDCVIWI